MRELGCGDGHSLGTRNSTTVEHEGYRGRDQGTLQRKPLSAPIIRVCVCNENLGLKLGVGG